LRYDVVLTAVFPTPSLQPTELKNCLTNSSSPLIIILKLFIYLRNLCRLMTKKNFGYLVSHVSFFALCAPHISTKLLRFYLYKLKRAYRAFKTAKNVKLTRENLNNGCSRFLLPFFLLSKFLNVRLVA
jgi:hypothetical protein